MLLFFHVYSPTCVPKVLFKELEFNNIDVRKIKLPFSANKYSD